MKFNDNEMEHRLAAVMTAWGFIAGRSKKFWVEDLPTYNDSPGWACGISNYYDSDLVYYRVTE